MTHCHQNNLSKVEVILDEDQLREEIGFLRRTLRTKRRLASLRADRGPQPNPAKAMSPYEHGSTKIGLLMDWARAVCDFYSLKASQTEKYPNACSRIWI